MPGAGIRQIRLTDCESIFHATTGFQSAQIPPPSEEMTGAAALGTKNEQGRLSQPVYQLSLPKHFLLPVNPEFTDKSIPSVMQYVFVAANCFREVAIMRD